MAQTGWLFEVAGVVKSAGPFPCFATFRNFTAWVVDAFALVDVQVPDRVTLVYDEDPPEEVEVDAPYVPWIKSVVFDTVVCNALGLV
jgi:hypothetical protein